MNHDTKTRDIVSLVPAAKHPVSQHFPAINEHVIQVLSCMLRHPPCKFIGEGMWMKVLLHRAPNNRKELPKRFHPLTTENPNFKSHQDSPTILELSEHLTGSPIGSLCQYSGKFQSPDPQPRGKVVAARHLRGILEHTDHLHRQVLSRPCRKKPHYANVDLLV